MTIRRPVTLSISAAVSLATLTGCPNDGHMSEPDTSQNPVPVMTTATTVTTTTDYGPPHKLIAGDGEEGDSFGRSVALSGNTAIIGAFWDTENGSIPGSAYLFDTTTRKPIAKLLPEQGQEHSHFGMSVAISGNTAIVGSTGSGRRDQFSGAAYLFDATTGEMIAKLVAHDGASGDRFGCDVAISGNVALVGAKNDDDNGTASGSAYLFDATTGKQIAKLLPDDGQENDSFGTSVAINGNVAVVGAVPVSGHGDLYYPTAEPANVFDVDTGETAYGFDVDTEETGYVFDVDTGKQIAKLLPEDGAPQGDGFAASVAITRDTALIGADGDTGNEKDTGAGYLYIADPSPMTSAVVE